MRLARLYQPAGTGPFPAVLQARVGAWNNKDRTDCQLATMDFVSSGIVVLSAGQCDRQLLEGEHHTFVTEHPS